MRFLPKIVKWGLRFGTFDPKLGGLVIKGKRGGKGHSNSGAAGKRASRWYQGRFGRKPQVARARAA